MEDSKNVDIWLIPLCFAIIYLVWGSTYVAIAWTLESFPPFILAAIRFAIAGLLIISYCLLTSSVKITRNQLKNTAIAGFLFFFIGNGFVVWGIQYVESGLAALIISLQPMNIALLLWWLKGERPKNMVWLGLFVGIFGMALLVGQPSYFNNINWLFGLGAIVLGMCAWAIMSVKISEVDMPKSILLSSGIQMLFGSLALSIFAVFRNEHITLFENQITNKASFAMAYLIIFGSILAFTAFNYLLQKVSPTRVATAAYVNPVVALFLGWWLNNENLSFRSIIASAFLLAGVVLINLAKRENKLSKLFRLKI